MQVSSLRFPGDVFADFEDLARQMEQLFGMRSPTSGIRSVGRAFPPVNIGTSPDAVHVYAFAPGIDTSKLDVSVDRGVLTIAGERKSNLPEASDKVSVYGHERIAGTFRRAITLPEDADPDRVEARYANGVLEITVQKREASKPRRIEISDAR